MLPKYPCSLVAILLVATLLPLSAAQEKSKPAKAKTDQKQDTPAYVKLNVGVTTPNAELVNDLEQNRFHVFEDDVPQNIVFFERKAQPPGFVLVIDCSMSLRTEVMAVQAAAKLLVRSKAPDQQVMILCFISSDKISRVQNFTANENVLANAIESLYLEGGQSAIIDAISVANDALAEFTKGAGNVRRPLIVITDGEDRQSYFTEAQLINKLKTTGAEVEFLAFEQSLAPAAQQKAASLLNRIASGSGGEVYAPTSTPELSSSIREMLSQIRMPYVIGYQSTNPARDGKFRKVRVDVESAPDGPNLKAFARDGYTAPKK
jgi:VWFA-related protein